MATISDRLWKGMMKMTTTNNTNLEFMRLVWRMRKHQKLYFEMHLASELKMSKDLEKKVDDWLIRCGFEAEKIKQMAFNSEKPN